jgi:hypothetical protein
MRRLPALLTGLAILLLTVHAAVSVKSVAAGCPDDPVVAWANNAAYPDQISVPSSDLFSTTQNFAWCGYETTPFIAVPAVHNWSAGVCCVDFTPGYFFPEDVFGNRDVLVEGTYTGSSQGTLDIKVTVYDTPPAQVATKRLYLNP